MMTSQENKVLQITPSPDSLVIKHCKNHGIYTCSEGSCSFETSSPSLLGLHKACVHKITTGAIRGEVKQYFCPAPSCHFKPASGRCFKNLDSLRTHYTKVHGEKKFKCCKCEKAFGLERECLHHEKECGQNFICLDCGKVYNNKKALLMHCAYKQHTKPKPPDIRPAVSKKCKSKSQPRHQPKLPQAKNRPLVPLLPKFPASVSATNCLTSSAISIISSNLAPKLFIQSNQSVTTVPVSVSAPLPSSAPSATSLPGSHNNSQALKTSLSVSSQPRVTYTPAQTGLSILNEALQSSKICARKMRSSNKKLNPKVSTVRKRRATTKDQSAPQWREPKSRITVATLTDFPRNTGSQTIFSIFQNQQRTSSFNVIGAQDRSSIYTQTCNTGENCHGNNSFQNNSNNHHLVSLPYGKNQHMFHPGVPGCTDSVTQTVFPQLTMERKESSNNQKQLEPLKQFSHFQTQTQQIPALDSSTQTLQLNPGLDGDSPSYLLEELLTESERNDVDTQTFGSFFADMMTQTLEDLASEPTGDLAQGCAAVQDVLNISDMTTQTFDQMMDNDTQTFDLDISECMTQTTFTNENMTQTLSNFVVDTTTQTFDCPFSGGRSESLSLQDIEALRENTVVSSNITSVQTSFENDHNMIVKHSANGYDGSMLDTFSPSGSLFSQVLPAYTPVNTSAQRSTVMTMDSSVQPLRTLDGDRLSEEISLMLDCSTQTLRLSDEDLALETLLSDMATQTLENDSQSSETFLDPATIFPLNSVTDFSCQTPDQFYSHHQMTDIVDKSCVIQRKGDPTEGSCLWEIGKQNDTFHQDRPKTQTDSCKSWEIAAQTVRKDDLVRKDILELQLQSSSELWEMGTQTGTDILWEMGTQTGTDKLWEMGTQTGTDKLWEMGTQTGVDEFWEMGTQTGTEELWEMGTQTGTEELWEMGTQTGMDELWEMGTQTGTEELWEMGTQTGIDEFWEMGTQTGTEELWEMGTQTGTDEIWEMGTQTGTDDLFDIGTQTKTFEQWGMGTQTGAEELGEKGTQTQRFIDLWEMGTQTGGENQMPPEGLSLTGTNNLDVISAQTQTPTEGMSWERQLEIDIQKACAIERQILQDRKTGTPLKGKCVSVSIGDEGASTSQGRSNSSCEPLKNSGTGNCFRTEVGELLAGIGAIGTQTEEDFLQELSQHTGPQLSWEMGTQTMSCLVTEGETQTSDSLVDLLTEL